MSSQKMTGVAAQLAAFATSYRYQDLPEEAVKHAAMLIASSISSAALGSSIVSARIVRDLEIERGGRPEASIWFGASGKVPVVAAARVNAMMSDAAASDDSDLRNIVHSGTTACAAALALAERLGSTGQEILAATVLGYEVAGRINSAMIGGLQAKGFHGSIVGSFAGAVAAARLLQLDPPSMTRAIALTATSVGGLHIAGKGSVAREYHAGNAAMMGVQAALAAQKGFLPEVNILEMKRGFFDTFGNKPDADAVTSDFGKHWKILTEMGIKLVPGGTPFHAIAEAGAKAASDGDVQPDEVATITVSISYPYSGQQFPTDLVGIAHSPAYFASAGVADRDFTWIHAFEEKINDPRIRGLLGKVRMGPPPTEQIEKFKSGAIVTIETLDGRTYSSTIYAPKGAAMLGIQWPEIESKVRSIMPYGGVPKQNIESFLGIVENFHHAAGVDDLLQQLRAS